MLHLLSKTVQIASHSPRAISPRPAPLFPRALPPHSPTSLAPSPNPNPNPFAAAEPLPPSSTSSPPRERRHPLPPSSSFSPLETAGRAWREIAGGGARLRPAALISSTSYSPGAAADRHARCRVLAVAGEDVNGCGDDDLKLDSPNLVLIRRAALPLLEPRRLENGDCWPPSVPVGARRSRKLDLPSPGPSESPLPLPADELPGLSPIFSGANQATARSIASVRSQPDASTD